MNHSCHSFGFSTALFLEKSPGRENTWSLHLNMEFIKDKKRTLGPGESGASGALRSMLKEQEQMEQEGKWECHPCCFPPYCPAWMPPLACRMEPLLIITQCTWALQPPASTAAGTRGPRLSVRDAPRKERAALDLGRPLCSLWAGGDRVPQGKGG